MFVSMDVPVLSLYAQEGIVRRRVNADGSEIGTCFDTLMKLVTTLCKHYRTETNTVSQHSPLCSVTPPNIGGSSATWLGSSQADGQLRVRVRVRVTLRLTVRQSVCLGVEPRLGLMTR
jgi:hypothetical protein